MKFTGIQRSNQSDMEIRYVIQKLRSLWQKQRKKSFIKRLWMKLEQLFMLNPQRIEQPICNDLDLDFQIDGPGPYTHMDVKHPVGSEILLKQNSPWVRTRSRK